MPESQQPNNKHPRRPRYSGTHPKRFKEKYGHDPTSQCTAGFVGGWIFFAHVLPKAEGMDAESIRKAALSLDIPIGNTVNGWGVKFNPPDSRHAGQNNRVFLCGFQWQDGNNLIVYPEHLSRGKMIVPLQHWLK